MSLKAIVLLAFIIPSISFASKPIPFNSYNKNFVSIKDSGIEEYIKDDSSKALFQYFYHIQHKAKKQLIIWGSINVISIVLLISLVGAVATANPIVAIIIADLIIILLGGIIGIFTGILNLNKYNDKKLEQILKEHQKGIPIPKKFTNKRLYKKYIADLKF